MPPRGTIIATGNPYRERVLAYGRALGLTHMDDRKMERAIRHAGGMERLQGLTPEVQRILMGVTKLGDRRNLNGRAG